MKHLLLLILLILPLSCYDGLNDMYDNMAMKVPICVNSATGNDLNDGRGWGNAKQTIQGAIDAAEEGDEIWVTGNTYLYSSKLLISINNLSLYGGFQGTESRKTQRDPESRTVAEYTSVVEEGCIISSSGILIDGFAFSSADCEGGAISITSGGTVVFRNCRFSDNKANSGNGGAISIISGELIISDSFFTGNSSSMGGGAIYVNNSVFTVSRSRFGEKTGGGNSAVSGGAIYAYGASTVNIQDNCEFYRNGTTSGSGGAVYAEGSTQSLVIENSFFGSDEVDSGNTSSSGGGAVYINTSGCIIKNNEFIRNVAGNAGGGARFYIVNSGSVEVTGCTFRNNQITGGSGGGIHFDGPTESISLTISNSEIGDNISSGYGGGIRLERGTIDITETTFSGNTASTYGAGISSGSSATLNIARSDFTNNSASGNGGGALHAQGKTVISSCDFRDNSASTMGGAVSLAILVSTSSGISDSLFYNNSVDNATGSGGALYLPYDSSDYSLVNLTFYNNQASQGGAVYINPTGSVVTTVNNSVYYGNTGGASPNIMAEAGVTLILNNCFYYGGITGGPSGGSGCITGNSSSPFISTDAGSSSFLYPNSLIVNMGINTITGFTMPSTDLAGNPRIAGGTVDIGCYEQQ